MPTLDEIRTLTIQAITVDVDKATADLNKLADAQGGVAVASDTTTESTTSVAAALDRQQRSLDVNYRSQVQFNKAQLDITRAFNDGLIPLDRYNQLSTLNQDRLDKASASSNVFKAALSGVQLQLVALSAGAGPVGVFLASLGPIGLVAAAGLGAVVSAIEYMVAEADRMGTLAQQMKNLGDVTGLTAQQIQSLEFTGAKFGATNEEVANTLVRFSTSLAQLRQATGPLFTDLNKINPQLVLQLSSTTDVAQAWNLLATAYTSADKAQQNLLSRAIGGQRGNIGAVSQLLSATAGAGGIGGLQNPADSLTQDQITKWASLRQEITETEQIAKNLMAEIWTPEILERQKQAADAMLNMAQAMKDMANEQSGLSWWQKMLDDMARAELPGMSQEYPALSPSEIAKSKLGAGLSGGGSMTNWSNNIYQPATAAAAPDASGSPLVIAAQYKEMVAALGSAATAQEQLHAKILQLNADLAAGTITQETYNRAVAGAGLDTIIQLEGQRISLLGQSATVSDIVKQKEDAITQARQKGVMITAQEAAGIVALTSAQKQSADLQVAATLGVADPTKLLAQAQVDLAANVTAGIIPLDKQGDALVALTKKYKDLSDASAVAGSRLPQLTQMGLDAGNLDKQLDTLATGSLNNLTDAIVSVTTNASTMGEAFTKLGQQVVTALEKMIVQMTIIDPLAKSLTGSFGGGFSLLGLLGLGGTSSSLATANSLATGAPAADLAFAFSSGGMVGMGGTPRWVHPAYFENAPHFDSGGMITDGGVPIIAHPGERVLNRQETADYNSGGSQPVSITNYNDFRGADPGSEARMRAYVDASSKQTVTAAVQAVAKTRSNNPRFLQGR